MIRNKKFSAILAVLAIGFFSVFADGLIFNSGNQTQEELNVTLNMQSGAQIPVMVDPGQNVPTNLNGDQVIGIYYNGQYDPAGANAVMQAADGSTVTMMWQMAGGTALGFVGEPPTGTLS